MITIKRVAFTGLLLLNAIPRLWAQTPQKPAGDSSFLHNVLQDVEVVAKPPTLRSGMDKKVFSVNQSLVSVGGTAADLLPNIPSLQVDGNGNINLRGATKLKVLVDGKQSLIGGGSVTQILQSIPAASIEKIEIITNPSAKYDAEGQGVINIILKKSAKPGDSGSVTASAGTRSNYNAGAGFNYPAGKAELHGNYSFQRKNTYSNGFQKMTYLNSPDSTYYSNEIFPSTTIRNIHIAGVGVDYHLSPRDMLNINGLYNATTTHRDEYLTIDNLTKQQTPAQLSNRTNVTNGWNTSWGATVDLTHKFKKLGEELAFDFAWSTGAGNSLQVYSTRVYNIDGQPVAPAPDILRNTIGGKNRNYNLQLDYILPLGKGGRLEAGARSQLTTGNDRQLDNIFRTDNQVHAVYINYRQQVANYTLQAGLRAEAGRFAANLQNYDSAGALVTTPIDINTNGLYPSFFLTRQLGHGQQVQLSYTRRINRPTAKDIDPFPDVSDPVNYDMGNPKLRPESIHSIELTYKKTGPAGSLTAGLYYNQTNNVIKHIQTNPINDVTITISENLRQGINTGFEFIGNLRVSKIWSFTANINVLDRINSAAPQYGIAANSGISWNGNITNDFSLARGLSAQLRADFKAGELILQDRYRSNYGIDAGAKYDLAQGRAALSFSARDIFNTRIPAFLRVSDALLLDWQRITYSSRATLTFTWRFGNNNSEPKRQR